MLQLKVVTGVKADHESHQSKETTIHGANVLYDFWSLLVGIFIKLFAQTATLHLSMRLFFCGGTGLGLLLSASNHTTKQYPYKQLHNQVLYERGIYGLIRKKNNNDECDVLVAYIWVDQGQWYFIAISSSMAAGTSIQCYRYRQMNQEDPNVDAELVHLTIAQPTACEIY
jgi:hypothetical protein